MHFCAQAHEFGVNLVLKESKPVKRPKHEGREAWIRAWLRCGPGWPAGLPHTLEWTAFWKQGLPGCAFTASPRPRPALRPHTNRSLVVFVQGQKRFNVGKTTYICDGKNFLLTSVDLPVVSQVIAATQKEPILGLLLKLEMPAVREILSQQEFPLREESADTRGMAVGVTSLELLDACSRLVDLLDAPEDIPFLSSLIQREIIYPLAAQPAGKAPARHCHAGRAEPSDLRRRWNG